MEKNHKLKKGIKVFAPASVSNVGPGFDVFGFPFPALGDTLTLEKIANREVNILKITGENGVLSKVPFENTAGRAILAMYLELDIREGVNISLEKNMPLGSGLGSSAASAVAAVFAMNELFDLNLDSTDLVRYALEGEKIAGGENPHADNVAPAMLGEFTIVRSLNPLDLIPVSMAPGLFCGVLHPHIEIKTKEARAVLPNSIALKAVVTQMGNLATLILGLTQGKMELIRKSTGDLLATPYRKHLIPQYDILEKTILEAGAIGFGISGSGPSMFMFATSIKEIEKLGSLGQNILAKVNVNSKFYFSALGNSGPKVLEVF